MNDRTIKILLTIIVTLLALPLLRPLSVMSPVQAEAPVSAPAGQSALAVNSNLIYVLQGNQLSVFYLDIGQGNPFEILKLLGDEKQQEEVRKTAKLKLLVQQDINRIAGDGKKAR